MVDDSRSGRSGAYFVLAVLLLAFGTPSLAGAEGEAPKYELFGGYAFLRDQEIETNFPLGWNVSLARNLGKTFGIVADAGGSYKSEAGTKLSVHALFGGPRLSFRGDRVTPYVEALAGVARARFSAGGVSESSSDFAVQGGVGFGVKVTDSVSFRTGAAFRNIFTEGESAQEFRAVAGLSVGFGGGSSSRTSSGDRPSASTSGRQYGTDAPDYELFGGYAFLRDQEIDTKFPIGWNVSLARKITNSISVVGDVGGNYKSEGDADLNVHALFGGARYSFRGERVTPYVEALAGVARAKASAGGASESVSDFAVQGGLGLGFRLTERVWFRTGADIRNIFSEGDSVREFRVVAGVSFRFGGGREPVAPELPPPVETPFPAPRRPPPSTTPAAQAPRTPTPEAPVAPQLPERPLPPAALARGQQALSAGNYSAAAEAFRTDLRASSYKYSIPAGVYCEASHVAQQVRGAGDSAELFLLRLRLRGRYCYGLYWGLFDSSTDAGVALGRMPLSLITSGQAPMSVSRILARSR